MIRLVNVRAATHVANLSWVECIFCFNYQLTRGLPWLPYGHWYCVCLLSTFCARYLRKLCNKSFAFKSISAKGKYWQWRHIHVNKQIVLLVKHDYVFVVYFAGVKTTSCCQLQVSDMPSFADWEAS